MAGYYRGREKESKEENIRTCCIFIDNSNFFIEGQKASAKRQQFNGVDIDFRFRINYESFMDLLIKKRGVLYSAFYCSGSLHAKLRKILIGRQIEVLRFPRNMRNHEKQLDTALTAHVTRKAIEMASLDCILDLTFVIVAGDSDYIPAFEQVMEESFKLEVYAWKNSISRKINKFAANKEFKDRVRIFHLDDYVTILPAGSICFTADKWDKSKFDIPPERSVVFQYTKGAPDAHELTEEVTKIIMLPCKYLQPDPNTIIVIVVHMSARPDDVNQINKKSLQNFREVVNSIKRNYLREMSKKDLKILDYSLYLKSKPTKVHGGSESSDEGDCNEETEDDEDSDDEDGAELKTFIRPCIYKYACNNGNECRYFHSKKEKLHFKLHPSLLGEKYKSRNCKNFENGTCHFKVCIFAHGLKEALCYFCDRGGKVMGHWMKDCPNKKY